MSYANHVARPPTPPGGRSSINKFVSSARNTPNLQQLYLDSATRRDAAPGTSSFAHGLHSRSGSLAELAALHKLLEGREGEYEWARKTDEDLALIDSQKKGTMLGWYYARQNAILDSWNEVDVILFSPFPAAILQRFASKDQVRQSAERNKARKAVKFYTPTPQVPDSPASSALEFNVSSSKSSKRDLTVSPGTSLERKPLVPAEAPEPQSSNTVYGSLSDAEVPDQVLIHKNRRYSGKTLADLFDSYALSTDEAPDTIIEMPPEDESGPSSSRDELRGRSGMPKSNSELGMPPMNKAAAVPHESDVEDDTEAEAELDPASRSSRRASVVANMSNPDGKREQERRRLMAHVPGLAEKEDESEAGIQFAININLAANVALLLGKILACLSSRSISLFASLIDSALDLLSTLIIFGTSRLIAHRSFQTVYKYPVGKRRFEPLGVVIFSVLMIGSFLQVLVESVQRLWAALHNAEEEVPNLPLSGLTIMLVTVVLKAFMWIIYRKSRSSGVRAVAQDAENDVVFNVVSLIFPRLGQFLGTPALDPIGGILLSLYIIHEWLETLMEQVTKLSGKACGSEEIARALYLVTRFKDVESVSGLEVYHAGDGMIIEADVVLPYDITLKEAHDVGEVLTFALECLTDVERAYVHLDYNAHGPMGHLAQRG